MLFPAVLIWAASIAARVSAESQVERSHHNATIQSHQKPIQGVRKMSDDEGEKFFMDYWNFEVGSIISNSTGSYGRNEHIEVDRRTILPRSHYFQPPFLPGIERYSGMRHSPLVRRDFECPAGTHGCSSISRPDSCCRTDETCVIVEDTGSGDVGCCPAGQGCSGTIGSCWEGYTSCSSSLGGGCCIPGYDCVDGGCARVVTITITLSSTTLTTTSTETIPPSTTTTTDTSTTADSTTSSDGTSSGDLSPPDRPTSISTTTSSGTETETETETETACPTGFYACAAFYQGGCCRTGRDCDTTSCPAIPSTTIVSNDNTIVIPEPTSTAESNEEEESGDGPRQCATGWFRCADTVGGGCCPTGYACGSSCTAVPAASTTGTVAKEAPTIESGIEKVRSGLGVMYAGFMTWMIVMML
ncbi:hypothetical protein BJY04DRAFT_193507 [Aspergillus karnatakaensis]|uniref:putative GPI anchored protein n=1 Tax=Aspergillus karnatakaensis TaxID=1810916 RepID=UPI003CCD5CCF